MKGALLVAGTHSDAGKSVVAAGICRWLARQGVRVAPFKAQNMALNSVVTRDGAEIGRAQAVQAAAAGLEPEAAMNPILIKPSGQRHSQVIVMGKPYGDADARSYQELKHELRPVVAERARRPARALRRRRLRGRRQSRPRSTCATADLTNMWLAREAAPAGDRGRRHRPRRRLRVAVRHARAARAPRTRRTSPASSINKFRGDDAILAPGLDAARGAHRPPDARRPAVRSTDLWMDVEDSLALEGRRAEAPGAGDTLDVAVIRLRWMSNFTDADALAAEPGVRVRFTRSPADVERADLVVVPGTKATVEDLERLRADGARRRARRARRRRCSRSSASAAATSCSASASTTRSSRAAAPSPASACCR